jgi:mono/diheme cytochrome c family protein
MIVSKTPKVLFVFVILALAGALVVAGCGGSGGTTTTGSAATGEEPNAPEETEEAPAEEAEEEPAEEETEEAPAAEAPAEEKEAGGEEGGANAALSEEGKTIFTTTCGSCHTLKEAGTSGEVGPNLDELEPNLETVEHQVINGGGPMPAFGKEGILSSQEVKAVATYVSSVAGTE